MHVKPLIYEKTLHCNIQLNVDKKLVVYSLQNAILKIKVFQSCECPPSLIKIFKKQLWSVFSRVLYLFPIRYLFKSFQMLLKYLKCFSYVNEQGIWTSETNTGCTSSSEEEMSHVIMAVTSCCGHPLHSYLCLGA